jgi:urea transport system permease protein
LFLLVVTALPDGIIGWLRGRAPQQVRSLLGKPEPLLTYPDIELNSDVQRERQEISD